MNERLPNARLLVGWLLDARMLRQKCVSKTVRHVPWISFGAEKFAIASEAAQCRSYSHVALSEIRAVY